MAIMRDPISKWWPIGFAIAAVILYIIGGALYSSYTNSIYFDFNTGIVYAKTGLYYAGAIMCSLGGIATLAWAVTLGVYLIRRRPRNAPNNFALGAQHGTPTATTTVPAPAYNPYGGSQPTVEKTGVNVNQSQASELPTEPKYCGQCGRAVTTPYCPSCGSNA